MDEQCAATGEFDFGAVGKELYPHLVPHEIAPPRIVVPAEEGDPNPAIDQIREGGQHPVMASLDDGAVLEPEIEEVTIDDQGRGLVREGAEEGAEGELRSCRDRSEVDVGNDVDWLALHGSAKLPVKMSADNGGTPLDSRFKPHDW